MVKFDWTVNLGMLFANILLTAITVYVRKGMHFLGEMSFRVNVMWLQFSIDHPELVRHHHRKSDV